MQGVTPRTIEAYRVTYVSTGSSTELMDRRHFSPGQQTDYRMGPYKPELIRQATFCKGNFAFRLPQEES